MQCIVRVTYLNYVDVTINNVIPALSTSIVSKSDNNPKIQSFQCNCKTTGAS